MPPPTRLPSIDLIDVDPTTGPGPRGSTCGICCEEMTKFAKTSTHVTSCHNAFHVDCLETWHKQCESNRSHTTCPACRGNFHFAKFAMFRTLKHIATHLTDQGLTIDLLDEPTPFTDQLMLDYLQYRTSLSKPELEKAVDMVDFYTHFGHKGWWRFRVRGRGVHYFLPDTRKDLQSWWAEPYHIPATADEIPATEDGYPR